MDVEKLLPQAISIGMTQLREEIKGLAEFVSGIEPHNVLEIGSDRGGTFYLWTQIATGKKISIDLPGGNFSSREVTPERNLMIAEFMRSWAPDVHIIRCDSHSPEAVQRVFEILDGEKLDFLFIDGDHTYDGIRKDYLVYRQFVRPGGWIAFHDINDTEHHRHFGCFVAKLWQELKGHKIEISKDDTWGGIGLIQVG